MGVSGSGPRTTPCSAWEASAAVATWASSATVWCWKSCFAIRRSPAWLAREMIWMLMMESPPRAKKLSWMPTFSTPSTDAQMAASVCSSGVRGATKALPESGRSPCGAGSALRSTLPLGVSGRDSSITNAAGIMYSGSRPFSAVRRASTVGRVASAPPTYATSRLMPGVSSRTTTTLSDTPSQRLSADSTSPSSMRKPRTFTCESKRPRNTTLPSGSCFTWSPVRYSRAPGSVRNGCGTNFSAVSSGRPR
ncbi:hypothetical protein COSO111634_19375 [Corallococcus soli]